MRQNDYLRDDGREYEADLSGERMSGTDELAKLRKALATAEAELASSVERFEQADNPDRLGNDIRRAKLRVARAKTALATKGVVL